MGSLCRRASHKVKKNQGTWKDSHNKFAQGTFGARRWINFQIMEVLTDLSSRLSHKIRSSASEGLGREENKLQNCWTSWWLLDGNAQAPMDMISAMQALTGILESESREVEGFKAWPCIHGSCQRLNKLPFPTLYERNWRTMGRSLRILRHIHE